MHITSEVVGDSARVSVEGELTIYTVAELSAVLLAQISCASRLQLDLSEVTEVDGAGVQLLALIKREADVHSTDLSLIGQSQAIKQTLQLCRSVVL